MPTVPVACIRSLHDTIFTKGNNNNVLRFCHDFTVSPLLAAATRPISVHRPHNRSGMLRFLTLKL